jgi:Cu/Zn superoxide dismutase
MNRKLLPLLLIISAFCNSLHADHLSSNLMFTAKMSGDAEVPAVTTNGQGLAIFTFDEKKSTLYINVSLSNLSGPITGIHIHEGEVGVNGGVIYNLTPFLQGNRVKGTISNISRQSFAKFVSGNYYINAHTEENTSGEIRGQILLETDSRFTANLSGAQEVPAVTTDGNGLFVANLSQSGALVDFHMVFEGLSSDVTGAHIHQAPSGSNGGVIFDLSPFIFGNLIVGSWDPTGFLDALRAGELYINVHTVMNPGGEIRGQLLLEEGLMFDAILDGDQEFPSVDTRGKGVAVITVSPDLSMLEFMVMTDSLSGDITGAHFHTGNAGTNGGVIIDLTDFINGNIISGTVPITIEFLNMILSGGIYLNVHTEDNPGGEIRGQVYKLAREGYIFDLSGGQEVPPTTTTATGAGIVSIDRDQSNAHYMIVYSNLQGNFTASHFHNGAPGENGGVLFDITDSYNAFGAADDYWDTSFDATTSRLFRDNEIYVNIHSTLFPGGEIRGNVVRASVLFGDQPFDPEFENDFILSAELYGASENPPITTDGFGLATIYFGTDRTKAQVNVTVTGLSGAITGAHIHEGLEDENGPVIFPLTFEGNRIHTEITGITSEQLGKFISGKYYINVHTVENPGGEIRGQITLDQDVTFLASLSGDEEVPEVTTDGRGLGLFHYTIGQLTLDVNVQVTELSSEITGAHLHAGAPGENGGVIIDLGDLRDGNRIQGTVDLTIDDLFAIATGNVYVNVHTMDNPGGEIRGQLEYQEGLVFDGWMSGLQENPFATTPGSGLAVAVVSPDLENVDFHMVTDNVTGVIGAAHFHMAPVGMNGGVVLDLSSGLNDNDISFSAPISDQIVDALLKGEIYANVHTPAYPGGELRGQLFRLARDGYGFDLCPEQELGSINAPDATGSGFVSVDRLHSNINISVVTTGLTDTITGAHIHNAPLGMNGGVIFNLSPYFAEGAVFGYGVPMDSIVIKSIFEGTAYVNAHTTLHPGGEVRGQIVKELLCSIEVAVTDLEEIVNEVLLSPVPVTDRLNINIESFINTSVDISIFDLSGQLMSTDQFELINGANMFQLDTEKLGPGFYTLMIANGEGAQAYKFVK